MCACVCQCVCVHVRPCVRMRVVTLFLFDSVSASGKALFKLLLVTISIIMMVTKAMRLSVEEKTFNCLHVNGLGCQKG